jgi:hypothetical protein
MGTINSSRGWVQKKAETLPGQETLTVRIAVYASGFDRLHLQ